MANRPTWQITLRAPLGDDDERMMRRVKAFLKQALRSYQLVAVSAVKVNPESVVEKLPQQSEVAK